ncbi:hypothetical protein [Methanobacterium sp.]|uniref:HVO_A0114 family putative DNA-binding protein n=1 Tax=Methanobacterium sp. TaxID=2164 RepID=UPI0031590CE4
MIQITLERKITGSELIKDFEYEFGSLENLKKLLDEDPENVLLQLNLDDWKYHLNHPDAEVKDERRILTHKMPIDDLELTLMDHIKNENPGSVEELAEMVHEDVKKVHSKLEGLEEAGFIILHREQKDNVTPSLKYNSIKITI